MAGILLYTGCIAFAVGVFVRSLSDVGVPVLIWVSLLGLAIGVLWRRKSEAFSAPYSLALTVCLLCGSLGILRMEHATWTEKNPYYEEQIGQTVTLEGIVAREPEVRKVTQHLYVRIDEELLLVTTDRFAEIEYGDRIRLEGKLTLPEPFETELGRTFDYPKYLLARGVSYVVSFAQVEVLEQGQGNGVLAVLLSFKRAFIERIEASIPSPHVGLAEGLLLGVKQSLGEDIERSFRDTGIMHIVVLSGYNIMLVVTFVLFILAFLFSFRARLLIGIVAIILFALMVGPGASVIRASAMALLALIAKVTGRTYDVVRALLITGVFMVLWNPYLLVFDVGFQLSFVATLGLILVVPLLESRVLFMPTKIGLREFFTATVATQIFVTPLLLYQIGQFSVVALVVNMLVLPMVPVAMMLTFASGVVSFLSPALSVPIAYLAYISLGYILAVAEFFATLPFASFTVEAFPFYMVVISYGILGYLLWRFAPDAVSSSRTESEREEKAEEEKSELTSWIIVDEAQLKTKGGQSLRDCPPDAPKNKTPVFFR